LQTATLPLTHRVSATPASWSAASRVGPISGWKRYVVTCDGVCWLSHRPLAGFQEPALDFVADNPGPTLLHCHQQLHMDFGFMALFEYA
jgi:FtsP/CotA-like multicopper oxidase with cupredoxin domain